jgi:uncharacterized protein YciI
MKIYEVIMEGKQQFLYEIKPTRIGMLSEGSTEVEEEIVSQHFYYLSSLKDEGVVLLAGRTLNTDESSFGIVIFQAGSNEEALEIMNNDPAVKKNVMKAILYPFRIALVGNILD